MMKECLKRKKFQIAVVLLFLLMLFPICSLNIMAEDEPLVCLRAVQINDYQVVIEFSEPVKINYYGVSSGPYYAVRMTDSSWELQKSEENQYLQWTGIVTYADNIHDRLLFTITADRAGVQSVSEIMEYQGKLASYSDLLVTMCIEEVGSPATATVNNITSADGMKFLQANRTGGSDGVYTVIEKDFSYNIDFSKVELIPNGRVQADVYVARENMSVSQSDTVLKAETTDDETAEINNNGNAHKIAIMSVVGLLLLGMLIAIMFGFMKKGKRR